MRTVTATEASSSFAALLDDVEAEETVVVTRGGRRIAAIGPATAGNGREFLGLFADSVPDEDFASDVATARQVVTLQGPAWPAH